VRLRPPGALRTLEAFRAHLQSLGVSMGVDDEVRPDGPLSRPHRLRDGRLIGNRFCIHPMEGWDGTPDGRPSDLTRRRWVRFGESGAKLIWGGEAVAVREDGRANPNQLRIGPDTVEDLSALRQGLVSAHQARFGRTDDLCVGLQLTHSGRWSRPAGAPAPVLVQHHAVLDGRVGASATHPLISDEDLGRLAADFVDAAVLAAQAGFHFVDVKHCHGYLGHELLGAHDRPGAFGGSLENRTRFLRTIVDGIRRRAPGLSVGVRLSAFDQAPYRRGPDGRGRPEEVPIPYRTAFGVDPNDPTHPSLGESLELLGVLDRLGIELLNVTGGSPYYNPHMQRPALYPPSDGYDPPHDPLIEVARHLELTAALRRAAPSLFLVGSGYTYLQEWLPRVAQHAVGSGAVDSVGLGRMALSYHDLPADVLAGRPLDRKRLCRTFSDCTTAPRNGMVSGCYPLDELYELRPESARVRALRPRAGEAG
jgi:NADPH2 dehydrogenase